VIEKQLDLISTAGTGIGLRLMDTAVIGTPPGVKTHSDVLTEYEYHHPEAKCAEADASVCGKQTVGLLYDVISGLNSLSTSAKNRIDKEDVESGMVQDEHSVYSEHPDPRPDKWTIVIYLG
jgi:hypothetical protein